MSSQTPPVSAGQSAGAAPDEENLEALFQSQDVDASDITAALTGQENDRAEADLDVEDVGGDDVAEEAAMDGLALGELPDIAGTVHAADAVDYESEDSLAEEEDEDNRPLSSPNGNQKANDEDDWMQDLGDLDDNDTVKREPVGDEMDTDLLLTSDSPATTVSQQPMHQYGSSGQPPMQPYASQYQSQQTIAQPPMSPKPHTPPPPASPIEYPILTDEEATADADQMLFADMVRMEESKPLRMSSLFAAEAVKLTLPKPSAIKECIPTRTTLDADKDQQKLFGSHIRIRGSLIDRPGIIRIRDDDKGDRKRSARNKSQSSFDRKLTKAEEELIFSCYDWERKIVWDNDSDFSAESDFPFEGSATLNSKRIKTGDSMIVDDDLYWVDEDEYVDGVDDDAILEGNLDELAKRVVLDLNDTQLLVDVQRRGKLEFVDTPMIRVC